MSTNFAILRIKKISSMGSMASALGHCFRDRETPNANSQQTPDNIHLAADSTSKAMGMLRDQLPDKRRKDAVLAIEHVMTASPEFWEQATQEQQDEFFKQSMDWLKDKYGEENIIVASIHTDEKSPHLSAFVTPITKDGRLSAKEFIGSPKKLKEDQTTFAKKVSHLGLHRGVTGSKATHTRIQQYYENLNNASQQAPHISDWDLEPKRYKPQTLIEKTRGKGRKETQEEVLDRINKKIKDTVQPIADRAVLSHTERQNTKKLQEQANKLEKGSTFLKKLFNGLSTEQRNHLAEESNRFREENKEKQKSLSRSRSKGFEIGD